MALVGYVRVSSVGPSLLTQVGLLILTTIPDMSSFSYPYSTPLDRDSLLGLGLPQLCPKSSDQTHYIGFDQ